jgi:hypothetical protein
MPSVPLAKPTLSPPMFLTAGLDTITFGTDFTSTPSVDVLPLTGPACCAVAACEGGESGPDYGLHPTNTDRTRRRRRSPKLPMRCHRSATYES